MSDELRELIGQVSVPAEGRLRVLENVAREWQTIRNEVGAADATGVQPERASVQRQGPARGTSWIVRGRRAVLAGCACLVVLGAGGLLWMSNPRLEANELELALGAPALDAAASGESVPYTWDWPQSFDASLLHGSRRELVTVRAGHAVVAFPFAVRGPRGQSVRGRFVVVPVGWLKSLPAAREFLGGEFSYTTRHTATWWVEGNYAYACCLETGDTRVFERCLPRRWAT